MNAQLSLPDFDNRDREGKEKFVAEPSRIKDFSGALSFIIAGNVERGIGPECALIMGGGK